MHTLTLFGEVPRGRAATAGVVKELAGHCYLQYEKVLQTDAPTGYSGPLLEAPEGVYDLWQETTWVQLVIMSCKMLFDGRLVQVKYANGSKMLDLHHLNAFRAMLIRSKKVIHVYEEADTGIRQYLFLWPDESAPLEHPMAASCKYVGIADLETGKIT